MKKKSKEKMLFNGFVLLSQGPLPFSTHDDQNKMGSVSIPLDPSVSLLGHKQLCFFPIVLCSSIDKGG